MAFFDDLSKNIDGLGKKLSQTGQEAMNKTKGMADTFKLNSQLSDEQNALKDIYASIGELYAKNHAEDAEDEYAAFIARANVINSKITQLKEEIARVKGVETCPNCGKEIKSGTAFCPGCGTKLSEQPVTEYVPPQEIKTCPECGKELPADAGFCTSCGAKID